MALRLDAGRLKKGALADIVLLDLRRPELTPMHNLASNLVYPDLPADAEQVLRTLVPIEKELATQDGRWFKGRLMPYRTFEDKIDGVVLTFTEITSAKMLEAELRRRVAARAEAPDA